MDPSKYLSPWHKATNGRWIRRSLNNDIILYGDGDQIGIMHCHYSSLHSFMHIDNMQATDGVDKTHDAINEALKDHGYTLLTQEQFDKLRMLI